MQVIFAVSRIGCEPRKFSEHVATPVHVARWSWKIKSRKVHSRLIYENLSHWKFVAIRYCTLVAWVESRSGVTSVFSSAAGRSGMWNGTWNGIPNITLPLLGYHAHFKAILTDKLDSACMQRIALHSQNVDLLTYCASTYQESMRPKLAETTTAHAHRAMRS